MKGAGRIGLVLLLKSALVLAAVAGAGAAPFAYITNQGSSDVSVIDIATNTVLAPVPLGGASPAGVAVTPDGKSVYVAGQFGSDVLVIDAATNSVKTVVSLPLGAQPFGVAVTPDGSSVYVTNAHINTVSVIATATNAIVATVPVGVLPIGVVVSPDGTRVYVANWGGSGVSVIDTATNTVKTVVSLPGIGPAPWGVAVTPDGARLYVADWGQNLVEVIATATNAVVATVPVGQDPRGVAVTPDGTRVYVTNQNGHFVPNSDTVSVIDTSTNLVMATVTLPAGAQPFGVAVTPDGSSVYVANLNNNTVSVISTTTNAVVATVPVGSRPVAFGKFIGGKPLPVLTVPKWFQAGIPAYDSQGNPMSGSGYPGNFWAPDRYDSIPFTIRQKGCALTTLTILANFWAGHINNPTDYSPYGLDPRKMNHWNGLYCTAKRNCYGDVEWNNFASVANTTSPFVRVYQACPPTNPNCTPSSPNNIFPLFPDPKDTLDNILRNGVPVILPIFKTGCLPYPAPCTAIHFVVVTGKTPNGDYKVNDPGDIFMTALNNLQKAAWVHAGETLDIARSFHANYYIVYVGPDPATGTYKAIVQKDPSTAQALGVYSSDPVEFVLTDPQGRRTGFDPASNTSFQEIPTSAYSSTLYRDDQDLSAPDPPPFKSVDMANQVPGQYMLDVIGTGSGDFSVEVRASDAAGNWITQTYAGTTAPGAISRFAFQGTVTTFAAFGANLAISPSYQAFGGNGTFTLGQGGTISPMTQPVTIQIGNAFVATIPAGSFELTPQGTFVFGGVIQGVLLAAELTPTGADSYAFAIAGAGAPNLPSANPVDVRIAIGSNGGSTPVNAIFVP